MQFYKDEVKRIGVGYKVLLFLIVFFEFINRMGNASYLVPAEGLDYLPFGSFWGSFLLIAYLNGKLFWIKEQGENVFLPAKYEITPLTRKTVWTVKIGIMIRAIIIYLLCTIATYYFTILAASFPMADGRRSLREIGMAVLWAAVFALFFLAGDLLAQWRAERDG